eukprot:scaffold669_cov82-Phaeocystis_antarctica.AAC.3
MSRWSGSGFGLGLGTLLAIKRLSEDTSRHNSASTLLLGIFVPAAGLQAKGNLRYLVVCGVFSFRAQMSQHIPVLSENFRARVIGNVMTKGQV